MLIPTGLVGLIVARRRGVPLVVYSHGGDVRDWRRMPRPLALARAPGRAARGSAADELRGHRGPPPRARRASRGGPARRRPHAFRAVSAARGAPRPLPRRPEPEQGLRGGRVVWPTRSSARGSATSTPPRSRRSSPRTTSCSCRRVAEPFGLVAVEAIASGRWVVASAVGGLREIVRDGVNGTLVTDGDFAGALARVPDYDPYAIAPTVERYSLAAWQAAMARDLGRGRARRWLIRRRAATS